MCISERVSITKVIFPRLSLIFQILSKFVVQASSDISVVDFDIPFSLCFVLAASVELVTTIGIMASVTWQVLFVAIFATIASKYVQV